LRKDNEISTLILMNITRTHNLAKATESTTQEGEAKPTHTYLLSNFPTVVKVIKSKDPLLTIVIFDRNVTL